MYLAKAPSVHSDGTWRSCPKPFQQLYTLHGYKHYLAVPLVYCLLTNKDTATYRYVLDILAERIQDLLGKPWTPPQFTTDFESAMISAVRSRFPHCQIHGCSFHFGQAVLRYIGDCGLKSLYETEARFTEKFRFFLSLQYLEPEKVRQAFLDRLHSGYWDNFGDVVLTEQQKEGVSRVSLLYSLFGSLDFH